MEKREFPKAFSFRYRPLPLGRSLLIVARALQERSRESSVFRPLAYIYIIEGDLPTPRHSLFYVGWKDKVFVFPTRAY